MKVEFVYTDENINWHELSDMYKQAPLGNKSADDLQTVFANSRYKCFLYDQGVLIGAGRALADGIDCSYICDVALLPEYQRKGIGKKIIDYLLDESRGHKKIILYSVPGSESFYKKSGFMRMSTAMAIFDDQDRAVINGLLNDT